MTVEEFFVQFLSDRLDVPVSGDVPSPLPERFVTVELLGSNSENCLYHPRLAVQSWAGSRMDAARLNAKVKYTMCFAVTEPKISRCVLETDYNFPELEMPHPRYQAVFDITYLE